MTDPIIRQSAIVEILRSKPVQDDLVARANRIASAAGPGMQVRTEIGPNRARAAVITGTTRAVIAEATDRALTRSITAGRG